MYPGPPDQFDGEPLSPTRSAVESPFDLTRDDTYLRWREWRLETYTRPAALEPIEISDPRRLTKSERTEITSWCRQRNFCLYALASPPKDDARDAIVALGKELGLNRVDPPSEFGSHPVATLSVDGQTGIQEYIPYTNRPLNWHTDGYYNHQDTQVRGVIMHCVRPATDGGENTLLDPELVYIKLRDFDRNLIGLLMAGDAMAIPANIQNRETLRPVRRGPVFSVAGDNGKLHMRYTARTKSIDWSSSLTAQNAGETIRQTLDSCGKESTKIRLGAHQGIICNNVLHTREGFSDVNTSSRRRIVLRARYYDRVANT